MRMTKANKELARFVICHGTDKVENLAIDDYTYDYREDLPLTYKAVKKDHLSFISTSFGAEAFRAQMADYEHYHQKKREVTLEALVLAEIEQMLQDMCQHLYQKYEGVY